jgi:type III restriction enzyme/adenine-specific DNA-methyltransferase
MIKDIMSANESITPNQKEIAVLRENFPSCFRADGSFDIVRFSEFLKDKIDISQEGYELKFLGKNYAKMLASLDTETVIVPDEAHNSLPENANSENIYISGDNLDGLKHLLKSYAGQVKCIYIDPPYNTGSDGFVYNDNFNFTVADLVTKLSIDEEQAQRILDLTNRGSASHSAWLMFMYPRLQLARDLLAKDGVIFISIDDNECHNLKLLCDDVFGEDNCLGIIANINNPKGRSDDKYIATSHEYILVYSKNEQLVKWYGFEPTDEKIIKRYNKIDENGKKYREIDLRKTGENDLKEDRPNLFYYFYFNTESKQFYPSREDIIPDGFIQIRPQREDGKEGNWRWSLDTAVDQIDDLIPKFMPTRKIWGVMQKDYLEGRSLVKSTSSWTFKDVNSERGTETFISLGFDKRIFPKPKPLGTIKHCIELSCKNDDDVIILDFFSGSATTAHSVMDFNVETGGHRKFILVQLPEEIDQTSEAYKVGYHTIDEIGQERIVRAAKKIKEENPNTTADLGFKHYTLNKVSQNTLDKMEKLDNSGFVTDTSVYDEFGVNTVLTTWLVHDNYGFVNKCKMINLAGYSAYWCENHLYFINPHLTENAIKALIDKYNSEGCFNPQNIVIFGYSFNYVEMENLKTNIKILRDSEKNLKINLDIRY